LIEKKSSFRRLVEPFVGIILSPCAGHIPKLSLYLELSFIVLLFSYLVNRP
jgi:hypothetical protein